jgi:phthalate 4,5-dioxygenase oxygenase subunit
MMAKSSFHVPLSREENKLLTRVADGAAMGRFLRENYWLPATLSQELVADGSPKRVRLLGQRLVAFRATDGRVGIFDEACPHRRVSLALARNEDNALRCIFHGWKFDVSGVVREVPTQSRDQAAFCSKVPLKHYPVREAAGIAWVFLGSSIPPELPAFAFMGLPASQVCVGTQSLNYNWIQNLDGLADSSHIGIMHREYMANYSAAPLAAVAVTDTAPEFEFQERTRGFRFAAIRRTADKQRYARVSEFVAPFYMFIAHTQGYVNLSVPADDETTTQFLIQFSISGPAKFEPSPLDNLSHWPAYPIGGPDSSWGQNRQAMKHGSFSGFGIHEADFVVAESQGAITERSDEFLGDADAALMRLRRLLLDAVREFEQGGIPQIARHDVNSYAQVWVGDRLLSGADDWRFSSEF